MADVNNLLSTAASLVYDGANAYPTLREAANLMQGWEYSQVEKACAPYEIFFSPRYLWRIIHNLA
jgi:hypothetical protein